MLHLYQARHLKLLAEKFYEIDAAIEKPLLSPYPVIIPGMAVGQWLTQYLANKRSICANMERIMPGAYLWRLARQFDSKLPERSEFDELSLFPLLSLLDEQTFLSQCPRLSHYLENCGSGDKVELTKKIASTFFQYQIYRPDWLNKWSQGSLLNLGVDESWQQALWQKLTENAAHSNRAIVEATLAQAITDQPEAFDLPKSLCLFGITTPPPGFIHIVKALAKHIDIHLFAFTSQESEIPNDVLPHWHETGEGFNLQFEHAQNTVIEHNNLTTNYLQYLQNVLTGKSKQPALPMDESITCVSCYSPMREVEAVHDFLLNRLSTDKNLQPGNILIALPDLETYAPYIRAVFESSDPFIPYTINDSLTASESPLVNGLMEVLSLPEWRFTHEEVMVLLNNHLVQKRFEISDLDLEQIQAWLTEAGIRWGINGQHRQEFDLPDSDEHTWQAGLDRLLLGFALPKSLDDGDQLFNNVLPVDEIESGSADLLSRFVTYFEQLVHWRKKLKHAYSPSDWKTLLQNILGDFFHIDGNEEKNKDNLLCVFDKLAADAKQSQYDKVLDIDAIKSLLSAEVTTSNRNVRPSGCINIVSMSSMATVPFKQVCIIGMNYDAWPSQDRQPGFDLMQKHNRSGDKNKSLDERALTLQLILAAEQDLYLSYTGRNINNGDKVPPSVLLSEIIDFNTTLGHKISLQQHPMHVFSPDNFTDKTRLQSHNKMWLETAEKLGSGRQQFPLLCDARADYKLEKMNPIAFDDLTQFFSNPQSHFLRNQLGISLSDDIESWNNTEPFSLGDFADKNVREVALKSALKQKGSNAENVTKASGLLPHGRHGELLYELEQEKIDHLVAELSDEFFTETLPPVLVDINLSGYQVVGSIRELRESGFLIVLADELYPYQKVKYWLQHLLLCCSAPQGVACKTHIHHLKGDLIFTSPSDPRELLSQWLSAYQQGQNNPLSFFAKSSYQYARKFNKKPDHNAALKSAKVKWDDGFKFLGENAKINNQYLYRDHNPLTPDFEILAKDLLLPMISHEGEA
jgi:exodeoxyribonuclease V gamma subunit